jgi:hypothetical protein
MLTTSPSSIIINISTDPIISQKFSYEFGKIYCIGIHDLLECDKDYLTIFYELYIHRMEDQLKCNESIIPFVELLISTCDYRVVPLSIRYITKLDTRKKNIKEYEVELHHGFVDDQAVLSIKLKNRLYRIASNNTITIKMRNIYITFTLDVSAIDIFITLEEFEIITYVINEYKTLTHNWRCYAHNIFTLKALPKEERVITL